MQEWLIPGLGWGECKSTQIVKTYEDWECPIKTEWNECTTPWGTTVTHWDLVLSFDKETASIEDGCKSRTSICNDGEYLDGNDPYDYEKCWYDEESIKALTWLSGEDTEKESCDIDLEANHCTVNWFVFANWTSQIFYTSWTNSNGKWTCDSQKRSCTDWVVSWDNKYQYYSCHWEEFAECLPKEEPKPVVVEKPTPKPVVKKVSRPVIAEPVEQKQPNCPSPFGWYRWAPGQTGTAYKSASVPNGSNPPSPCSSACWTVAHWDSVTTYNQSVIAFGNGQTCESNKVTSTCNNWTLSPGAGSACSCEIAPASPCVAPNGQTVSHESSLTLYQYPKVQALPWDWSDTCVRQWRQCINGTFHDWNWTPASFTFRYPSCDVIEPPAGWGPGWEWVPTA